MTAIERNMLVSIKDVDEAGVWRGLSGQVKAVRGPSVSVYVPSLMDIALLAADLLEPSPQLNLLRGEEDLDGSKIALPPNFRGAVVRSFLEVKVLEGHGIEGDPAREVVYLLDPEDGKLVFKIDDGEITIQDRRPINNA